MKKKICLLGILVALLFIFCSCECKHEEYSNASCTEPSICLKCEYILSKATGHKWIDATCTTPKTCSVCQATDGDPLGHSWVDATCTIPKSCSVCQATDGDPLGHSWSNATCTTPKTCSVCQTIEGVALEHDYTESITSVATCDQDGAKLFSCSRCSYNYSKKYSKVSYSANEIYEMAKKSVGEITTFDKKGNALSLGTGFVFSTDGKIITNYHVIEDAYSAKIKIEGIEYSVQYVLAYEKELDLAVLKINAQNLISLTICEKEHVVGATVYAFGSSKGLTATFSQGIITYASREVEGVVCVQHDAAISSGNSGGPLINQYGETIGINTWTLRDSQNLNFAIRISELKKLVYNTPLSLPEFYEKECDVFAKLKNLIVSKGTFDSSDNEYELILGYSYSSDYCDKYTRRAIYDVADDIIYLYYLINTDYLVSITIDEVDGVYSWGYYDKYDYIMLGTLYANTFTSNSLLGVSYNNFSYSSLLKSARSLASTMVIVLCQNMDADFKSIGVTAEDLGFLYF